MRVNVPIKAYLKKFALKYYDCEEVLQANKHTTLGIAIESILRNRYKSSTAQIQHYDESIPIELNQDSSNLEVRIRRLAYINYILDKEFKRAMFLFVSAKLEEMIPAQTGIKDFLKFYGVAENEYGSDSAYRQWLRMRNHEYKRKQPAKLQRSA